MEPNLLNYNIMYSQPPPYGHPPMAPVPAQYPAGSPPPPYGHPPPPPYGHPPPPPPPYGHPPPPPYGQPPMAPVPTQYPTGIPPPSIVSAGQWSSGLCDCCSDCKNCFITHWCPCITVGRIADILDRGNPSCVLHGTIYVAICYFTGCQWIYSAMYRTKIRKKYMLPEEPCNNYILHCCCELCAICQAYRELKHRGFDMSLGWDGNVQRQTPGIVMPVIAPMEMKR